MENNNIKVDISVLLEILVNIEAKLTGLIQAEKDEKKLKEIGKLTNKAKKGIILFYKNKYPEFE